MKSLLLVIFSEEDITHSCENSSIVRQFCEDNLIPLQSLFGSANYLVNVSYLKDSLRNRDDRLNLLQSLKSLNEEIELFVNITQVIESFYAIGLNSNGLKI